MHLGDLSSRAHRDSLNASIDHEIISYMVHFWSHSYTCKIFVPDRPRVLAGFSTELTGLSSVTTHSQIILFVPDRPISKHVVDTDSKYRIMVC